MGPQKKNGHNHIAITKIFSSKLAAIYAHNPEAKHIVTSGYTISGGYIRANSIVVFDK